MRQWRQPGLTRLPPLLSSGEFRRCYFIFRGRPRLGSGVGTNVVGFSGNGWISTGMVSNFALMRSISSDTVWSSMVT